MAEINVYEQYFEAEGTFNEVDRRAALVMLISDSHDGEITYKAAVTFFPHRDEEDYGVSYDAYFEKTVYASKGRRSRKREQALLKEFQSVIDELSEENSAEVFWDKPLREARLG